MRHTILLFEGDRKLKGRLQKALPDARVVVGESGGEIAAQVERERPDMIVISEAGAAVAESRVTRQLQTRPSSRGIPVFYVVKKVAKPDAGSDRVVALDELETLRRRLTRACAEAAVMREIMRRTVGAGGLTTEQQAVLRRGGFSGRPVDPAPLLKATEAHEALFANGLTVGEAARRLGVTEGRVRQRLNAHPPQLIGLTKGGQKILPAFQFTKRGLVPNIDKVIEVLPETMHPVAVSNWLTEPNTELEISGKAVSPLAWLSQGGAPERAVELAEDL